MFANYDKNIRNQVENVISLVDTYEKEYQSQGLTLPERQNKVKELIRGLRYNSSGYFWIDNFEGVNILHPILGDKEEGKNRKDLQDKKGNYLIRTELELGQKSEDGFWEFWWPKPNESESSRKRAYVKSYLP